MEAVVFQPQTYAQVSLLQDLAKAMRIPVTLFSTMKSRQKAALLAEMQTAGAQAQQIASGEVDGISFDQLLNELDWFQESISDKEIREALNSLI